MENEIFEYTDDDGDTLQVRETNGRLWFKALPNLKGVPSDDPDWYAAALNTVRVRELHSALGRWLADNGITMERTPETARRAPNTRAMRALVRYEVARVLPLHLAPIAQGAQCSREINPGDLLQDLCVSCGFVLGLHRVAPKPKPKPKADAPVIPLQGYCVCGHTKWAHTHETNALGYGCEADMCTCVRTRDEVRGHETVPVSAPRLMSQVRRRSAPAPGPKCTCTHDTYAHSKRGCVANMDASAPGCDCQWEGIEPDAGNECGECGHAWEDHGRSSGCYVLPCPCAEVRP
jgi:hypothetical protein